MAPAAPRKLAFFTDAYVRKNELTIRFFFAIFLHNKIIMKCSSGLVDYNSITHYALRITFYA
jgi:hypothetical protein